MPAHPFYLRPLEHPGEHTYALGIHYWEGRGVDQCAETAVRFFKMAAELGYPKAKAMLATAAASVDAN